MDLWEYFESTGATQEFLAKKSGVSRPTINKIFLRKIKPKIETAWAIEKATKGKVTLYDWVDDSELEQKKTTR